MISLYVQVLCEINRDSTATIEELAVRIDKTSTTVRRVIEELKAIYQRFPNDDLADLLDSFIREGF